MVNTSALAGPSRSRERRREERYPIAIPVEIEGGTGVTRDVSVSGVFFETDRWFSPGEPIQLILVLKRVSAGNPVRLRCEGRVVRVERREMTMRVGLAVAIDAFRINTHRQQMGSA